MRRASTTSCRRTSIESSPTASLTAISRSPSAAFSVSARPSCGAMRGAGLAMASTLYRADAADLPLQLHDSVEQGLRRRRAARHVDVDRDDAVAAAHHRIAVMIIAAAVR